jgi:hypothetical protein
MTTLLLDNNTKFTFSNINELKIFVYENYWYPEINQKIEETWYKNWKPDFESKTFSNIDELLSDLKN